MKKIISVDELQNKILAEENLHPGDKISYDRLMSISNRYGLTPYALSLGIFRTTQTQYRGLYNKHSNAKNIIIFKRLVSQMIEDAINLRETIMKNENLKEGDYIDYIRLSEISNKYNIPIKVLAVNVLEIVETSYTKINNNHKEKVIIFYEKYSKRLYLPKENKEIEMKREEIIKNESLKIGSKISINELIEISDKYKIDIKKLALEILEIPSNTYYSMKSDEKRKSVILRFYLTDEKLNNLKQKIITEEKLYSYQEIDYETLQRLSNKYLIDEKLLATKILSTTSYQFYNAKHNNSKIIILKDDKEDKNYDEIRKLIKIIFEDENIKVGDRISYARMQEIKKKYNLSEEDLLYVLGITPNAYIYIRVNKTANSIVKDTEIFLKTLVLSELIEKDRFYTKKELEEICDINNISIEDFIKYIVANIFDFNGDRYINALNETGRIWVGRKNQVSIDFIDNNMDIINAIIEKICDDINSKEEYKNIKMYYLNDDAIKSDILSIIRFSCGDIEESCSKDELYDMLYSRVKLNLFKMIENNLKLEINNKDSWSNEDIEKLIILSDNYTIEELSVILKKDKSSIKNQIEKNNLECVGFNDNRRKGSYTLKENKQ